MATPEKTIARLLTEKLWGSNFIESIPIGWRAGLKYLRKKTPGVENGSDPDDLVGNVVASQVTTNRTNELEKETTELDAAIQLGVIEHEQDLDEEFNIIIPKQKYLTLDNAEVGQPSRRIKSFNPKISEVEKLDLSAIAAAFDNVLLSFPSTTSVKIPDFLTGFQEIELEDNGDGSGSEAPVFAAWGGDHSFTTLIRQTAQGSSVISREVVPIIVPFYGSYRSTTTYIFLMPMPVTRDQVIARLTTLTGGTPVSWPAFSPRHVTITIISRRISLQVNASTTYHDAVSTGGNALIITGGSGFSKEIGFTVKTIRVPPTIHGNLSLSTGRFVASGITVEAHATPGYAVFSQDISMSEQAYCDVSAAGLGATPGATSLPSSGILIVDSNARPYRYNYAMIHVETIDASTI